MHWTKLIINNQKLGDDYGFTLVRGSGFRGVAFGGRAHCGAAIGGDCAILGRYSCTLEAGINWICVPFQLSAGRLSLKIESVPATVEVKTSDNMFVSLPVNLMIQVEPQNAKDAFINCKNPRAGARLGAQYGALHCGGYDVGRNV